MPARGQRCPITSHRRKERSAMTTWNDDHPPGTAAARGRSHPPAPSRHRRFRRLPALLRRGTGRHQLRGGEAARR
jgi:hypothetical protein